MSGPNVEDFTPGWQVIRTVGSSLPATRWRMVDEIGVMHLLLKADTRYLELHGLTLHVYDGPSDVDDSTWPLGDPTTFDPNAEPVYSHVATSDVSSSALTLYKDESDVWAWLERYASNDAATR